MHDGKYPKLQFVLTEAKFFIYKQAKAAIFGGVLLIALLVTKYISVPGIYRYDLLFIIAIITQVILILTKNEEPKEILVIAIFHICAMTMELFKTSPAVGSWAYPEPAIFAIGSVPLFTGFMYSAIGSYIARSWRINHFEFKNLPSKPKLLTIGILIYANFFTNHFIYDLRYLLFAYLLALFWKTKFYVDLSHRRYQVHPLLTNFLFAFVIWMAEQAGTFARAWIYPNQADGWHPVSFHMFTSWYMLLIFSFVLISLVYDKETDFNRNLLNL